MQTMEMFDLKQIIERYNLNTEDVAKVLFPHVRYQKLALDRVLRNDTYLNTEQLQALAKLAGVLVSDLFTIDDWKGSFENKCLTFKRGTYTVKLNYNGVSLSIYKETKLVYQELVLENMSMTDFISYIDNIIIYHESVLDKHDND